LRPVGEAASEPAVLESGESQMRVSTTSMEDALPDKQMVYAEWKAKEGQEFEDAFEKNRADLKERRGEMKNALTHANLKKHEIDTAKELLARKQADRLADRPSDEELIDEEEYALIKSLKDAKQQYKEAFERHRVAKMDVIQIEHLLQQCKTKLVQSFEEWYDQRYGHSRSDATSFDRYDPQEQFDLMEAERLEQHPDSLAYHSARKTATRAVRSRKPAAPGARQVR